MGLISYLIKNDYIYPLAWEDPDVDNEVLLRKEGNYVRMGDFSMVSINKADHYDLYGTLLPSKQ